MISNHISKLLCQNVENSDPLFAACSTKQNAAVSTIAGAAGISGHVNAVGTDARFNLPTSIALHPSKKYALILEDASNVLPEIDDIPTLPITSTDIEG